MENQQGLFTKSAWLAVSIYILMIFAIAVIGTVGFSYGVYSAREEIEAARIALAAEKSKLALNKFEPPSDMQCVKYLFNEQNLSNVKRRVCGRGY